jgi:hypothetical protein
MGRYHEGYSSFCSLTYRDLFDRKSGGLCCTHYRQLADTRVVYQEARIIKFNFRNHLGTSLELKFGDEVVTLEPGAVKSVALPVGARIT